MKECCKKSRQQVAKEIFEEIMKTEIEVNVEGKQISRVAGVLSKETWEKLKSKYCKEAK